MKSLNINFYKQVCELKRIPDLATKIMVLKDFIDFHQMANEPLYTEQENSILINLFKEKLNELQTKEILVHS